MRQCLRRQWEKIKTSRQSASKHRQQTLIWLRSKRKKLFCLCWIVSFCQLFKETTRAKWAEERYWTKWLVADCLWKAKYWGPTRIIGRSTLFAINSNNWAREERRNTGKVGWGYPIDKAAIWGLLKWRFEDYTGIWQGRHQYPRYCAQNTRCYTIIQEHHQRNCSFWSYQPCIQCLGNCVTWIDNDKESHWYSKRPVQILWVLSKCPCSVRLHRENPLPRQSIWNQRRDRKSTYSSL